MSELEREHRALSWDLTTTATTADQEIGSYTPKVRETFVIQAILIEVYFTTVSTTAALLGALSLYYPETGEYLFKNVEAVNPSSAMPFGFIIPIPEGWFEKHHQKELKAICTPATTTSIKWIVQLLGYDK